MTGSDDSSADFLRTGCGLGCSSTHVGVLGTCSTVPRRVLQAREVPVTTPGGCRRSSQPPRSARIGRMSQHGVTFSAPTHSIPRSAPLTADRTWLASQVASVVAPVPGSPAVKNPGPPPSPRRTPGCTVSGQEPPDRSRSSQEPGARVSMPTSQGRRSRR